MEGMKCKICGSVCFSDVVSNGYTYWKCKSCFTSQVIPQPTPAELNQYYTKFHLSLDEGGVYAEYEERIQEDFKCKVDLVAKYITGKDSKLLDVACGKGFFLKQCSQLNVETLGIDLSQSAVEFAENKLKVKAICGRLEDRNLQDSFKNKFDIITMWAGIEHVPNPAEVVQAVYHGLKPGGIFIMDTGLGNAPFEKYLTGHSQWYSAPEHLFVFSVEGLARLANDAGFQLLRIDKDFDRNIARRYVRKLRHAYLCLVSHLFIKPVLGSKAFMTMKESAKWPIGKLVSLTYRKPNE